MCTFSFCSRLLLAIHRVRGTGHSVDPNRQVNGSVLKRIHDDRIAFVTARWGGGGAVNEQDYKKLLRNLGPSFVALIPA